MSGHSKWANIKHKKSKMDAVRGKAFTKLSRQITMAAREGGGDIEANFRLRLAVEKAKAVNMPNDIIDRAIKRGSGELAAENYEELLYEGYGPGGVAVLLEIATDNRNRTAGEVRSIFSRHGGNLGESGCVAWMFDKRGLLSLAKEGVNEDELMLDAIDAGANDVVTEDESINIYTEPASLHDVKTALEAKGYSFTEVSVTQIPKTTVDVNAADAERLFKLLDALEEHDDVQEAYANFQVSDEILQKLEG